jgi:glycosyltransferase involved in cell wall biosynthesis
MLKMVSENFRIYIDGLFFKGSGIGRYYESLVKEMSLRGIKIYTCVPVWLKDDFEENFKDYNNIEVIYVSYSKYYLKAFAAQSVFLKKLEKKVDLFFYPHINLPFYIPENTVVTVHDLTPFTKFWDRNILKRNYYKFIFKRAIRQCKGIITISEATRNDIIKFDKNVEHKVKVIYEFVDDKFIKSDKTGGHENDALIKGGYILFIGNRKKHKNLESLISAYDKIKYTLKYKLVIAGSKDKNNRLKDDVDLLIQKLDLKDEIIELISPDDETVINLYKNAKLLVFPSLYEGFGLPPLEAMSCGCPAAVSDIPVLREVCGDAAIYFNPESEDDIAAKIIKICEDKELRQSILLKGKERLKFFDKEETIKHYVEFLTGFAEADRK